MSQRKMFGVLARQWATTCMLFVGVFGPVLPVWAAERNAKRVIRELEQNRQTAENLVRFLPDPRLAPLLPLFERLAELRDRNGLSGATRIGNTVLGDTVVSGFTGVTPFEFSKNGVRSVGQITITANPYADHMTVSTTVKRGETEWNFDHVLSLQVGGMLRSEGPVVKLDVVDPESPKVTAVAWADWQINEDVATGVLLAENTAAQSNIAAAASADDLANDAFDGAEDCPAVASAACTVGAVIVVAIIIVVTCYILCWLFWWLVYDAPDQFDLRSKLQRELEGGGRPCYV